MYEIYEKLRDEKGWNNKDVSEMTGITNMTLSDWKRGKTEPKTDKYILLADLFGVSLDYIVRGIVPDRYNEDDSRFMNQLKKEDNAYKTFNKFFGLPESKKKHVLELINLLSE